jgi:hypothetical protein
VNRISLCLLLGVQGIPGLISGFDLFWRGHCTFLSIRLLAESGPVLIFDGPCGAEQLALDGLQAFLGITLA